MDRRGGPSLVPERCVGRGCKFLCGLVGGCIYV